MYISPVRAPVFSLNQIHTTSTISMKAIAQEVFMNLIRHMCSEITGLFRITQIKGVMHTVVKILKTFSLIILRLRII